jgi:hypothetical protein
MRFGIVVLPAFFRGSSRIEVSQNHEFHSVRRVIRPGAAWSSHTERLDIEVNLH